MLYLAIQVKTLNIVPNKLVPSHPSTINLPRIINTIYEALALVKTWVCIAYLQLFMLRT